MENQDKLFDKIKSAAENAETKSFPGMDKVWNKVEEKLDKNEDKKAIVLWKKLAIAASLLLFFSIGYQFITTDKQNISPKYNETDAVAVDDMKSDSVSTTIKNEVAVEESNSKTVIKNDVDKILEKQIKNQQNVAYQDSYKEKNKPSRTKNSIEEDIAYEDKIVEVEKVREVTTNEQLIQNSYRNSAMESNAVASAPKKDFESKAKMSSVYNENQNTITGVVTDDVGPLPGANVVVKGTTVATQTDFDGTFSLKANKGDELVISYIGMNDSNQIVDKTTKYNIKLNANNTALDEVVVTAFGIKRKPKELTYSNKKVDSKELEKKEKIIIGHFDAKDKNNALLIINGKYVKYEILEKINPNQIDAINVLKDKVATDIYGEKAKFGAILITTKKLPKKDQKKLNKLIDDNLILK